MKKLIVVSALLISSFGVNAKIPAAERESHCKGAANLAESIMESRQRNNLTIVEEIDIINKVAKDRKDKVAVNTRNVMKSMAIDAYSEMPYMTEEYQQRSVKDFTNKYFLECMRLNAD